MQTAHGLRPSEVISSWHPLCVVGIRFAYGACRIAHSAGTWYMAHGAGANDAVKNRRGQDEQSGAIK